MDEKRIISEYKKTFDDIRASEELKLRVLAQKPQKHRLRNLKPVIGVATSVAAAVMIFAAVGDYSFNDDNNGVIDETVIMQTQEPATVEYGAKSTESVPQQTEQVYATVTPAVTAKPTEELKNNSYGSKNAQPKESKAPITKSNTANSQTQNSQIKTEKPQEQTQKPQLQSQTGTETETELPNSIDIELEQQHTPEPVEQKPVQTAESNTYAAAASDMKAADDINSLSVDNSGESILKINDKRIVAKENGALRGSGGGSAYSSADGYHEEEWDNDRYFNYIGLNVTDKISLASDFSYTGEDLSCVMINSDGKLYNDKRIFEFTGADGRYVSIITSRDTAEAESYISNPSLQISEILGCKAVVFMIDDTYKCYMTYNGTSCIVEAKGITESEMGEVLLSLVR